MNILPISSTIFAGHEVKSKTLSYENIKKMPEYYPSSSIETTIGRNHKIPKEKVYFASPMEPISEEFKRNVDYIVYDNEPKYPDLEDIRKNYLEHNRTNYRDKFEEIRNYFYRREMGGFANAEEAKEEQRKAANCTGFYDRAGDLRYKKETTEDEIVELNKTKENMQKGIISTENEIKAQQELKSKVETHIENLKKMKKPYDELLKLAGENAQNAKDMYSIASDRINGIHKQLEAEEQIKNTAYYYEGESASQGESALTFDKYKNTTATYEAVNQSKTSSRNVSKTAIKQQENLLKTTIEHFKFIKNECDSTIKEMQAYIAELRIKSAKIDGQVMFKNAFIEDCKSQLEKHFSELQKYYLEKIVKR